MVVLPQFTGSLSGFAPSRRQILRLTAIRGLAGVVSVNALAGLFRRGQADTSRLGIAIPGGAFLLMALLARKKRGCRETGNKALRTGAVQSTCAYLAELGLLNRHWLQELF